MPPPWADHRHLFAQNSRLNVGDRYTTTSLLKRHCSKCSTGSCGIQSPVSESKRSATGNCFKSTSLFQFYFIVFFYGGSGSFGSRELSQELQTESFCLLLCLISLVGSQAPRAPCQDFHLYSADSHRPTLAEQSRNNELQ